MHNSIIKRSSILTAALLVLAVVVQFASAEFQWSVADFILAAILIFAISTTIQYFIHFRHHATMRIILGIVALLIALLYVELAVGIFGSPIAGS